MANVVNIIIMMRVSLIHSSYYGLAFLKEIFCNYGYSCQPGTVGGKSATTSAQSLAQKKYSVTSKETNFKIMQILGSNNECSRLSIKAPVINVPIIIF